jgi:predicted ATP-binding protein involved in virulence
MRINKNQFFGMRESGEIKNAEHYTIAEYESRGLRLEDLAQRIAIQQSTHFILYDYKGNIYTDNEDVLEILREQYPLGFYEVSHPKAGFNYDSMNIAFDTIMKLKDSKYELVEYYYIPKWYFIYKKLSNCLNYIDTIFTNKTKGEQLYEKLKTDKEFFELNQWINNFETVESLDPIHIFASINSNKLGSDKRIKRINILFRLLDTSFQEDYKEIDFNGCPAPIITQIIGARNKDAQNQIWDMFSAIIQNSQSANIDFKLLKYWYGLDIGSFTIFLFWIDAKNFLPLDKNTEALLKKYNKLIDFPKEYKEYKVLLVKEHTKLYISLAFIAYDSSKVEKLSYYENEELESYLGIADNNTNDSNPSSNDFRIIAIRPLFGCDEKYLKTLKVNEYYIFDKAYNVDNNKLTIDENKNISLFNLRNVNLNINAIVGKNGTGKSTLVELMFALINNISLIQKLNKKIEKIDNLKVEFIYKTQYIYKIRLDDENLEVFKYNEKNNAFVDYTDSFNIRELFYTIAVNYSQHSFNKLILGNWIHSLFHKNDSYKTPIVIEPYRKDGNIDVNRQEELIKRRLLSNLLLAEDLDDIKNSPRQLTEFYRAEALKFTFNLNKIFYKTEKTKRIDMKYIYKDEGNNINFSFGIFEHNYIDLLRVLYEKFGIINIPTKHLRNDNFNSYGFEDKVHLYILKKLVSIVIRYEKYKNYFNVVTLTFQNFKECVNEIYEDKSHICYKLKQAIYFLKFDTIIKKDEAEQTHDIKILSKRIAELKEENTSKELTTNELIPPAFFDIDIFLGEKKDINFNTLSSGEKQKIYSVNSILYHLNNIDSVDEESTKYSYVNIILDEIELYFHPELQRQYLKYLRHAISKADTNNILAINILFVTHSPFILSDIPDSKILFLDKENHQEAKSLPAEGINTFCANIHELLINGFFMQNSIGEFALEKIRDIIDFYNKVIRTEENDLLKLKEEYQSLKKEFYFIQKSIGEKYIADIIKNHIEEINKKLDKDTFIKQREDKIAYHRNELKKLGENIDDKY